KAWYMAIITPSRHMETLMLATVSKVRRRLRQQFFRTRGRNRSMAGLSSLLVYEFSRSRVPGSLFCPGDVIGQSGAPSQPLPHGRGSDQSPTVREGLPARTECTVEDLARLRATMEESHDSRSPHPLYGTPRRPACRHCAPPTAPSPAGTRQTRDGGVRGGAGM